MKSAISVARKVLEHTKVTFLVAEQATQFAKDMGFQIESLSSNDSKAAYDAWRANSCQPNYWVRVEPDANRYCGPYRPAATGSRYKRREVSSENHDTIGMVVIDGKGWMAAGTSTNGLNHKIPGYVSRRIRIIMILL